VPWVAGCISLKQEQGNHTPSPGAQLRQGVWLWGPVQWCRECETVIGHWTRGPPLPAVGC